MRMAVASCHLLLASCHLLLASFYLLTCLPCDVSGDLVQQVNGTEKGEVTLQLMEGSAADVVSVSWIRKFHHIITTQPGNVTEVRDERYKGRVRAARDASLIITSLNLSDQGNYTASVQLHNGYTRTIYYNLHVDSSSVRLIVSNMLLLLATAILVVRVTLY